MLRQLAAAGAGCIGGVFVGRIMAAPSKATGSVVNAGTVTEPPPPPPHKRFCPYGLPSDEHVVVRQGFASSLSYRLRIPNWVAEHYTTTDADGAGVDRKHSRFGSDEAVPEIFRATNADYRGSNLSRGHMAPAGAHKQSQECLNETFLLSDNIVPQELSNNGSDWLRLERWSKALVKPKKAAGGEEGARFTDVYVVSGPLFLPETASPTGSIDEAATYPVRRRVAYDTIGIHEGMSLHASNA